MATPPTLTVAIFAELPADQTDQRWVGVAGWTDTGRRYYLPTTQTPPPQPDDQLQLTALTQVLLEPPTSCGQGWKTWVLEALPPPLDRLPPHQALQALLRLAAQVQP
jgi:hypothetical protein